MRILFFNVCVFLYSFTYGQINLLYNWQDNSLVGSSAYDNTYNEIWGVEVNDHEIAIIGSTDGTHFIDVTDIQNAQEIAFVAGGYQGTGVIHRDYHDYNGYLYIVCDEGYSSSTLQIVDISDLPNSINVVYDSNVLFRTSHNIFIDTLKARLYACANENAAMSIYDISNPVNPTLIYEYDDVGHVHDIYVENDTGYANCGSQGLRVIDFTNLNQNGNYNTLAVFDDYPDEGYNHSGWLHKSHDFYVMADENHGYKMKLLDVSDLNNITVVSLFNSDVNPNSIAHNQIIVDDILYTSHYYDGLVIHDISDPYNPQLIGMYDTCEDSIYNNYKGAWGIYPFFNSGKILISDMQNGLFVFDFNNISSVSNDLQNDNITIYPNPFIDYFNIKSDNEFNLIELYNIDGKIINLYVNSDNINTEFLKSGLYFLKIYYDNKIVVEKIVKK